MFIGSHNSSAYQFDFNKRFWKKTSKWEFLRVLSKHFLFIRNIIINISKTQDKNILEQLKCGANILDIRVSQTNNIFYTSHTFCCETLENILKQIIEFLNTSSNKIIILIKADERNKDTINGKEVELLELVYNYLGEFINSKRIIIYYNFLDMKLDIYKGIKNMNKISHIWYNAQSVKQFIDKFNETNFQENSYLHCVLTPSENTNIYNLINISVKDYAEELNPIVIDLLKNSKKNIPSFYIFDFIDENLTQYSIQSNSS
jgi:hypothetical protein